MPKKILFSLIFFLLSIPSTAGVIKSGNVAIIDGDTIKIRNQKIRLLGIDAPEINQTCKMSYLKVNVLVLSKKYNCGKISKLKLKKFLEKKVVRCIYKSRDRYKRLIAECYVGNKNINAWMVRNGYAVAYRKYSKKFIVMEAYAKKNRLGIWKGNFDMPEKWRKKNKKN